MQKNLIITLLFSIIIAVFALLNSAAIPLNLIFVQLEVSTAIVILVAAALGAVLVYSIEVAGRFRLRRTNKASQKHYEEQLELFTVKEKSYIEQIEGLKNELAVLEAHVDAIEKHQAVTVETIDITNDVIPENKEQ